MIRGLPVSTVVIYNIVLFITLIYICRKYKKNNIAIFIIFLFWGGLFADMGKIVQNLYKMAVFGYSLFLLTSSYSNFSNKKINSIAAFFLLFTLSLVLPSLLLFGATPTLVFAQLYKYIAPFALLPILIYTCRNDIYGSVQFNKLFGDILILQIGMNIVKLLLIGNWYEGLVGSITGVTGGGAGTTLPQLGLLWFALNTNMNIKKKKYILFLIGMLFIGWMAGKRAIWLLFPIIFFLLSFFVSKTINIKRVMPLIALLPLFFYFGLRLSPTLNPERKLWGSFDPKYAWNYAMDYSTGKEDPSGNRAEGQGRVGANSLLFEMFFMSDELDLTTRFFGLGIDHIFSADYNMYRSSNYYLGVNHRGSLTGFGMFTLAYGIAGTVSFLLYLFSVITCVQNRNLKYILGGVILFDFIFYNSTIVQQPALMSMMMFLLLYSNNVYTKRGIYIGTNANALNKNL